MSGIKETMIAALECFHAKGFMHGNLMADNVLYMNEDERGCPQGLHLRDFIATQAIFDRESCSRKKDIKFPADEYEDQELNHLPACMFQGKTCELKLSSVETPSSLACPPVNHPTGGTAEGKEGASLPSVAESSASDYMVDPLIDMCSLKVMLYELFQRTAKEKLNAEEKLKAKDAEGQLNAEEVVDDDDDGGRLKAEGAEGAEEKLKAEGAEGAEGAEEKLKAEDAGGVVDDDGDGGQLEAEDAQEQFNAEEQLRAEEVALAGLLRFDDKYKDAGSCGLMSFGREKKFDFP